MRRALSYALPIALVLAAAPARAFDTETQSWIVLTAQGHVADRVRLFGELQPRIALVPETFLDRGLARAGVGWDLSEHMFVALGYAWAPVLHPAFKNEQRPFQQFTVNTKLGGGALQNRTRLEERFIEGADLSLRLRHLVRFAHAFSEGSPWLGVVSDELFVNLNAPATGPAQGLDQNRAFLGVDRVVGTVTLELGYMLDTVVKPEKPVLQRSNVIVGVALNLP